MASNSLSFQYLPSSVPQTLGELPNDIFTGIAPYLNSQDIIALFAAGNKLINHKLQATITIFDHSADYAPWTTIANFHFVELHIDSLKTCDQRFVAQLLPKTLKVIKFNFPTSMVMWIRPTQLTESDGEGSDSSDGRDAEPIPDLYSYFPDLVDLRLFGGSVETVMSYSHVPGYLANEEFYWTSDDWNIFFAGLPKGIEIIQLGELPACQLTFEYLEKLHTFKAYEGARHTSEPILLPKSVTHLTIKGKIDINYISIPEKLTRLSHRSYPKDTQTSLMKMKRLERLKISNLVDGFPVNIQTLDLCSTPHYKLLNVNFPPSLTVFKSKAPQPWLLNLLPASVTTVELYTVGFFVWSDLTLLPANLKTLHINGWTAEPLGLNDIQSLQKFPKTLTCLECPRSAVTFKILELLLPNIKYLKVLSMSFDPDALCHCLPKDLKSLTVPSDFMGLLPDYFQNHNLIIDGSIRKRDTMKSYDWLELLPAELGTLTFNSTKFVNPYTLFQKIPKSITSLTFSDQSSFENLGSLILPPNLTYANFGNLDWHQTFYQALPDTLTHLEFRDGTNSKLTVAKAAALPRGLETFIHPLCSAVVNKAFASLPTRLTVLNLCSCGSQTTDDCIPLLPRNLTQLTLKQAINWGEHSLKHLPPNLKILELHPDCPLLHAFSMKIGASSSSSSGNEVDEPYIIRRKQVPKSSKKQQDQSSRKKQARNRKHQHSDIRRDEYDD